MYNGLSQVYYIKPEGIIHYLVYKELILYADVSRLTRGADFSLSLHLLSYAMYVSSNGLASQGICAGLLELSLPML